MEHYNKILKKQSVLFFLLLFFARYGYGAISISSQPSNASVCATTNANFSVTVTGGHHTTYQWQEWTGTAWTNLTNSGIYSQVTTSQMQLTGVTSSMDNYQYRCIVDDANVTLTSNAAVLRVNSVSSASVNDVTVCINNDAVFTAQAVSSGDAALVYQWQRSTDGGLSYNNIAGATGASYTITSANSSYDNYRYRCIIQSGSCGATCTSTPGTLRVNGILSVTINDETVNSTDPVSYSTTVSTSGPGALTYQWQYSNNYGASFSNISGATGSAYTGSTAIQSNEEYRVVVTIDNCTPFTSNSIGGISALPVALIDFSASFEGEGVRLDWSSASEMNNAYYTIERSEDGIHFSLLLTQKGAGFSNKVMNYNAFDKKPLPGTSFYRLRQTDYNGATQTFKIVAVHINNTESILDGSVASPNPFSSAFILSYELKTDAHIRIELMNAAGNLVSIITDENQDKGHHQLTMNAGQSELNPGTYFVRIVTGNAAQCLRIIKY